MGKGAYIDADHSNITIRERIGLYNILESG